MGVDHMDSLVCVVITAFDRDGRKQIVHIEWIDSKSSVYREFGVEVTPFKRLYQLMRLYRVKRCVIDQMPNANEARAFARSFPGKVFLAIYQDIADVVHWTDKEKTTTKRASDKTKYKYRVILNRYMSIDFSLSEWKSDAVRLPSPRALEQEVRNIRGDFEPTFMGELFFKHLQGIIRERHVTNEETQQYVMRWINKSFDPHLVHCWNYAVFAMERSTAHRKLTFLS